MTEEFIHQLVIVGPERQWTHEIPPGSSTVGRQAGNDLRLDHPLVSRRHARLECTADACQIEDAGSSNGTTVDGQEITPDTPVPLAPGSVVKIGPFQLTYGRTPVEAHVEPEEEPSEPPAVPATEFSAEADLEALIKEAEAQEAAETPEPAPHEPAAAQMPPSPPPPEGDGLPGREDGFIPPGLSHYSRHYLDYLPGIYHTDFMSRFLAMFESILVPIEWNVDNFDLYLSPKTAPVDFLPWLANWFELAFDDTWDEAQRRTLLAEAHQLFARRGTRWALRRILEIYLECDLEIDDQDPDLEPFTFAVNISLRERDVDTGLIERIVDMNKPAHTTYKLRFKS